MSNRNSFVSYMVPSNMVPNSKSQTYDYTRYNLPETYDRLFNNNALAFNEDKTLSFSFKDSPYVIDSLDGMFVANILDEKGILARGWLDLPAKMQQQLWQVRQATMSHLRKEYPSEKYLAYAGFNYEASDAPMTGLRLGQSVHIFHEHVSAFPLDELVAAKKKTLDRHNRKDLVDIGDFFVQKYFDRYGLQLPGFSLINSASNNSVSYEELPSSFNGLNPYGFTFSIKGDETLFSNPKFQEEYNRLLKSFDLLHRIVLSRVDKNFYNKSKNNELFTNEFEDVSLSFPDDNKELLEKIVRLYDCAGTVERHSLQQSNSSLVEVVHPRKHVSYSSAFFFNDDRLFLTVRPRIHCGSGTAEMFGIELCRYYEPAEFKDNFVSVKRHCDNLLDSVVQKVPGISLVEK